MKPALHRHSKLPKVLTHLVLLSEQMSTTTRHSSKSAKRQNCYKLFQSPTFSLLKIFNLSYYTFDKTIISQTSHKRTKSKRERERERGRKRKKKPSHSSPSPTKPIRHPQASSPVSRSGKHAAYTWHFCPLQPPVGSTALINNVTVNKRGGALVDPVIARWCA